MAMFHSVDRKFKVSKLLYIMYNYIPRLYCMNLKAFVIYIICNINGGTLCYVLKIEGGFLKLKETPLPMPLGS